MVLLILLQRTRSSQGGRFSNGLRESEFLTENTTPNDAISAAYDTSAVTRFQLSPVDH
jgi:hypothetical protein